MPGPEPMKSQACQRRVTVTSRGTHRLCCERWTGCLTQPPSDQWFDFAGFEMCRCSRNKEPMDIIRGDGKHPDSLTLVPLQSGCSLAWDVTVLDTLARSYTSITSMIPYGLAEAAALQKRAKYTDIVLSHIFVPVAIESLGPIQNTDGECFLDSLSERLSSFSGDPREIIFLYQRISELI